MKDPKEIVAPHIRTILFENRPQRFEYVTVRDAHKIVESTIQTVVQSFEDEDATTIPTRMVRNELLLAMEKFPSFNSAHEGYAVLKEEVDELWDEIKNDNRDGAKDRMRLEAVQVAAMAIRFILDCTTSK